MTLSKRLAFATVALLPLANARDATPYCSPDQCCFPSTSVLSTFDASIEGRLLVPPPYGDVCYQEAFATVALAKAATPYCLPGQYCFPSTYVLSTFNASIGGRLLAPPPYGAVCYQGSWDAAACANLIQHKNELFFRVTLPAAVMYPNWELDSENGNKGCPVPDALTTTPLTGECTLGALASYIVNASCVDDIVKSVNFAAKYNLRLRIKNSGHDYTGRSTAPGSFTIWTAHLSTTEFITDFKPAGCSTATPVIAAGPAVNVQQLYAAGAQYNVTTIGGFTPSVGAAGGYIVGGGTGPLGTKHGLGVDNVVQFDVVLANGTQTSASACKNTDLFWAMRGGGGVFAVHTKVYIKAHPAFQAVNTVAGLFTANDTTSYETLVRKMVDLQPSLQAQGCAGIWETQFPILAYLNVQPFGSDDTVVSTDELFKSYDDIISIPGVNASLAPAQWKTWNDAYVNVVIPTVAPGGRVGINTADISRIISNDLMSSQSGRDSIANYILNLPAGEAFIFQLVAGGAVNVPGPQDTAVNPAWRTAFAFMDVPTFGNFTGVTVAQNATVDKVLNEANAVFGLDSYYNEEYPRDGQWQESQFGSNYARLVQIKKQVDPHGVFSCRTCVNSEAGY